MDYMIKEKTLTDIADAIREKKGSSSSIAAKDMADEILTIPTGGGVTASVDLFLSDDGFITRSSMSGTNYSVVARSFTMTKDGTVIFGQGSRMVTNTASNEGYVDIQKNGVSVLKEYLWTDASTGITIPDIDVVSGDVIEVIFGFDNYHTSCNFQMYSAMALLVKDESDQEDPFDILTDYTSYNVANLYSTYYMESGIKKIELACEIDATSGYDGFCVSMDKFNLQSGHAYTISFVLDVPSSVTFYGSYPWGIQYSSSRVPASGAAGYNTFDRTPNVSFLQQTGTQNVSMTFTASTSNYLVVMLTRIAGGVKAWIKLKNVVITEAS